MTTSKPRSTPQNRAFHALCGEIARQRPLVPHRRAFACEAWKRYIIQLYVREARWAAWNAGEPDPFPVRPVPSSGLSSAQYSELIEFAHAYCATHQIELAIDRAND